MRIYETDCKTAKISILMKVYDNEIPDTEDIDIALACIDKRIGKDVVLSEKFNSYRCPCCNNVMYPSDHYCRLCGQKVNWKNVRKD